MDLLFLIQIIIYVIFGTLIIYTDIKYAKIYNKHITLLFFLSIAINFWELFTFDFYFINIISFIIFYLLYKLKLMGAGDSKLLIVSILYFSNIILNYNQIIEFLKYPIILFVIWNFILFFKKIKNFEVDIQEFLFKFLLYVLGSIIYLKYFNYSWEYFLIYIIIIGIFYSHIKKYLIKKFEYSQIYVILSLISIILFFILSIEFIELLYRISFVLLIMLCEQIILHNSENIKFGPYIILGVLIYAIS